MTANGRDIMKVNSDGLPDSLRKFMLEHFAEMDRPIDLSTPCPPDIHPTRPPDGARDPLVNAVKALVDAGMPRDLIADAVSLISGKKPEHPPDIHPTSTRQDQIEARRRWDREYRRRKRAEAKTSTPRPPDSGSSELISSSSLLPLEESKGKKEETGDTRARAHPLPDDWAPNPKHLDLAQSLGHSPQDVTTFAADMRDWAMANAGRAVSKKTNWDAAFNNWIRRQRRPNNVRSGSGISSAPRKENGAQRAVRIAREAAARQSGGGLFDPGSGVVELDASEWTSGDQTRVNGHRAKD